MFERFNEQALHVVALARVEARRMGHPRVEPEHLLLGLLTDSQSPPARILTSLGIELDRARLRVEELLPAGDDDVPELAPLSRATKRVLRMSRLQLLALGHQQVNADHLLIALTGDEPGVQALLQAMGTSSALVRDRIDHPVRTWPGGTKPSTTARATGLKVIRPQSGWQRRYLLMCMLADALIALVSGATAYIVHFGGHTHLTYILVTSMLPLLWVTAMTLGGAYEDAILGQSREEFRRVVMAAGWLLAVTAAVSYLGNVQVARHYVLIGLPMVTVLTVAERYGLRQWLHRRRAQGEFLHRVVVVGHEVPVLEMLRRLGDERFHGLQVVAACLPLPGQRPALMERGVPVVGGFGSVEQAVRLTDADTVVVLASPDLGPEQLRRLAWDLEPTGAGLLVAPSLVEAAWSWALVRPVPGLALIEVQRRLRVPLVTQRRGDRPARGRSVRARLRNRRRRTGRSRGDQAA